MDPEETRLIERHLPGDRTTLELVPENLENVFLLENQLENDPKFIQVSLRGVDLCQEGVESIVHYAAVTAVSEYQRVPVLEKQGAHPEAIEECRERASWFENIAHKDDAPIAAYRELESPISAELEQAKTEAIENARMVVNTDKPPADVLRQRLITFVQGEARLYRLGETLHDLQSVTAGTSAPDMRRLAIESGQEAERLEGIATQKLEELTGADAEIIQRLAVSRLASDVEGPSTPLLAVEHSKTQEKITAIRSALAERAA